MTCEPPTNSHRDTRRYPRIALTPRRLTQNWVRFGISPTPARPGNPRLPRGVAARIPEQVPRHSLVARLFHWIMAASMLTLLFTAFLPRVGVQFPWVTYHWIAGAVLTVSILFHIIHASF